MQPRIWIISDEIVVADLPSNVDTHGFSECPTQECLALEEDILHLFHVQVSGKLKLEV